MELLPVLGLKKITGEWNLVFPVRWEIPRLCRGGGKSLTFTEVWPLPKACCFVYERCSCWMVEMVPADLMGLSSQARDSCMMMCAIKVVTKRFGAKCLGFHRRFERLTISKTPRFCRGYLTA